MKKNKVLIAFIIGIAVVIIGIIAAMFATGKIGSLLENFESETTTQTQIQATEPVTAASRPKSNKPESIIATVYSDYSEKSETELSEFEKFGFNTVIFDLTTENSDRVAALLESAKINNLYFGIRADIYEKSDYVTTFVAENNLDFVILGGCDETISGFSETVGGICKKIKETDFSMQIGIEPIYSTKASEALTELISSDSADFVFLYQQSEKISVFESAQTVWNEEASPLWLCHNMTNLSSFSTDNATEMISLISRSADMPMCRGLAFAPFTDITTASGTSAEIVLSYIQKRDTYLLDKDFSLTSHKKTNITVEQSTITFRGTSSPAYDLLCNGKKLNVAKNGDFSLDVSLNVGKNTIKFEHKEKTYTYTVTYKIKLLDSVSPSDNISVPGGMKVEVSAIAHKEASVSVFFNGKTYTMAAVGDLTDSDDNSPDETSDFTIFSATLETPQSTTSVQNLGTYKVTAKYSSLSESMTGASVSVTAKEIPPPPPPSPPTSTTQTSSDSTQSDTENSTDISTETSTEISTDSSFTGSLEKYNESYNYGLGSAKICEIIDDYVETYPGDNTKTFSVPDCSPLLKGTIDYVVSTVSCDNETYYVLASGVKVPLLREERLADGIESKVNHVNIRDGYVMPQNSIKVVSCSASSGETVIVLEMNRNVPFNAKLTGQSYSFYKNNPDRKVVVSSLNCTGLEFTFSDTINAEGDLSLMNSVCKGGNWSSDKDNAKVTLSFELAEKGKFYGFHYEYNKDGNLVITIKHKPSASLSGYKIMLDPGHGGIDPGAICAVSSTDYGQEKQINLSIAAKVKKLLEAEGADVIMTRTDDEWVCYTDRNNAVRNHNPDMFIAIHCDSSPSASAMGTSAYYYRAYSQPLAKAVHSSIVSAYKNEIYKDADSATKDKISRGADFYAFRVARVEECPAILIEYGFVSNTDECQILQTPTNRDILAAATVQGIKDYITAA